MQTHTTTTYNYSELSEEAKAHALKVRCEDPYNGDHEPDEAWETANAFNRLLIPRTIVSLCRREPATAYDSGEWEENYGHDAPQGHRAWVWLLHWVDESFDGVDQYPTLSDVAPLSVNMDWQKAVDILQGCPLTGVFYDCEVLDPIRKALEGDPRKCPDVDSLFEECGEQLQIALEKAIEWHSSEEANRGYLQDCGDDIEYLESGDVY